MGILDPGSDLDIYCLHLVCANLISESLDRWSSGWNNHKLRTHHNKSPRQLFIGSLINLKNFPGEHEELSQVDPLKYNYNVKINVLYHVLYLGSNSCRTRS